MDKEAFYFPHFCNARHDRKVKRVRKELGIEGYGIFFMLLEALREQADYRYPVADIDLLAEEFGTSEQKLRAVITNYGLFQLDEDEHFFSAKLIVFLGPYLEGKERKRLGGIKGNLIKYGYVTREQLEGKTADEIEALGEKFSHSSHSDRLLIGLARKGNERKGKEMKGKEIKENETKETTDVGFYKEVSTSYSQDEPVDDVINLITNSMSTRITECAEYWNKLSINHQCIPKYKYNVYTMRDREGIMRALGVNTSEDAKTAMDNYVAISEDTRHYKAFPVNYTFEGFIRTGIDQYCESANPHLRCSLDGKDPRMKQQYKSSLWDEQ